ncbi:MAG TPA: O-antigen ligase family protein, partial [Thermoanaerobaculia bacterium]|nr:O-antigen ligase family protein [Thermoanaerobaculia bacterium]
AVLLLRASRGTPLRMTQPGRIWTIGGILFAAVIGLQLIPMPVSLLRLLSPQSAAIWARAGRLAALANVASPSMYPITLDPSATSLHFFRVLAYLATFLAAMMLVYDVRRTVMASVLAALAVFETLYAVNEAATGRYAVWGWKNTLIFGRATGTFVNPNHFAHYAAILLPMSLYLSAYAWHTAAPAGAPFGRRFAKMIERRLLLFCAGLLAALASVAAVLVSESRGAMLAIIGGFALVGGIASPGRRAALRGVLIAIGAAVAIVAVIIFLGRTEAVNRIEQSQASQLASRAASIVGAVRIWKIFPLFGSGAGTYQDVVLMTRATSSVVLANHAHNDYAEILATTGSLGFAVALAALLGGYLALAKNAFSQEDGEPMSWRRRAFKAAALTSIAIAMIHALVDFNFFIPANPVTLAAIAGAAVVAKESQSSRPESAAESDSPSPD